MENQQLTAPSTQLTSLQKISQGELVRRLEAKDFAGIQTPESTEDAVRRGVPVCVVALVTPAQNLIDAIEFEIIRTAAQVNLNPALSLKKGQPPLIAKTIFDTFKTETIGDFKLAFARGSSGLYGEIFRLDGAVLVRWIQCYLEEKYAIVERMVAEKKEAHKEDDNFDPKEFYKRVRESADKRGEIDEEKKAQQREERRKEAILAMERAGMIRPKFICDGIEVTAKDEHYAREAYKETFGREPKSVKVKEPDSVTPAEPERQNNQ